MNFAAISSRRRNITSALTVALVTGIVLAGCGNSSEEQAPSSSAGGHSGQSLLLAENGLDGLDARQIIDRLDAMPVDQRPADLIASVEPNELILSDGGNREVRLPMPEDRVYVSVAPYRAETHECHFHSLTTCRGELGNTGVAVKLTGEDGRVLINKTRKTFDNGFVGFWVPRGIKANLTVKADGRKGTETLSTVNPDDATCITTMRLT
ncbi:MAG: CueP family metal-binding protein [Solirubrobacterales bacterium]|nr:CueP family metal-binding protein [Solirubrobacterales bacterium]